LAYLDKKIQIKSFAAKTESISCKKTANGFADVSVEAGKVIHNNAKLLKDN